MTKLLVVGATGLVGAHVLRQALADERITRVVALTRRPIAAREKLENIVIDFSELPHRAAWWSVDGVVSALGTTRAQTHSRSVYRAVDYEYPLAIARHAREHGATRLAVTSSLGADPRSRFIYTRTKGELESELKTLGFPSLTIVRPSVLEGHRDEQRRDERMAQIIFKVLAPVLPRRWRISPASAVSALLIQGAVDAPLGVHLRTNEDMA